MIKCPNRCYDPEEMVIRWPDRDTPTSEAYLCLACGKLFYLFTGKKNE